MPTSTAISFAVDRNFQPGWCGLPSTSLGPDPENDEGFLSDRDVSNAPDQERACIARDLVDKLCACLSPTVRDVFVLYSMEGWSHEELSRVFGVPRRAIKSRIFRARSRLREQWAKYN